MGRDRRKYRGLIKAGYTESTAERVSRLMMIIVSHVGYNSYKKFSAKELQDLLGNQYKQILEICHKDGLIKQRLTSCKYDSEKGAKQHRELKVPKRKGKYRLVRLVQPVAIAAIERHRQRRKESRSRNGRANTAKVLEKIDDNLHASVLISTDGKRSEMDSVINTALDEGLFLSKVDHYGKRAHNLASFAAKTVRWRLRPKHSPYARICESDIHACQAFTLFSLICNPRS